MLTCKNLIQHSQQPMTKDLPNSSSNIFRTEESSKYLYVEKNNR